ncbi:MAG: hypothetical protein ACI9W6_000256 [Motiliproteus sp.]|jgi:hypothetical protein
MAKKTNPLTNTEVKQAKPRDKEYLLVDGEVQKEYKRGRSDLQDLIPSWQR